MLQVPIWAVHLTVCCYHVTYGFQGESTLYICLNYKELLSPKRRNMSRLSDRKGTQTHNHLLRKRTLNHFSKLTKSLNWVVSSYLYDIFDCMFLSCHVRVPEWIHILYLSEYQETPCSKQVRYLTFNWLQQDWNLQSFSSWMRNLPFCRTDKMIELSCEYLSVPSIWLYVLILSRTRFRVNTHSIFAWMSKNCLLYKKVISEIEVTSMALKPTAT